MLGTAERMPSGSGQPEGKTDSLKFSPVKP